MKNKNKSVFIMILVIVVLAMLHLYIQNKSISLKYAYTGLKGKFQKLYDQNRYYNSLVSRRQSLERIEKIALDELRMLYPENMVYIIVDKEE
ncbi:MAG: hypothetical protein HQ564_03865 [Candidatus Saganbacteria bacterium]|nr:hypothetical protein [Candidatus Saganbacteria bacterium]